MSARTKESCVEWLGKIPTHWATRRLANCFREVARAGSEELPVLSISIHDGISDEELDEGERDRKVTHIEDRSKYKRVLPGDLAYNMMRAWQGGLGAVNVLGQVSPAYVVAEPTVPMNTRYVELLLRTPMAIEEMRRFSRGIADFRSRLYWEQFRDLKICLPPVDEQEQILLELGKTTARVDTLISKKTRFIELLREKRQALITHAVTKGLDATMPMKDSGVEWLGEVPVHWEVTKTRFIAEKIGSGKTPSGGATTYVSEGVTFLRSQNIYDDGLRLDDVAFISQETHAEMRVSHVCPGDVLLNITGASIGRTCIAPTSLGPANVNQHVCIVRCADRQMSEWVQWVFQSAVIKSQVDLFQSGAGREGLNFEQVGLFRLAIPPRKERDVIDSHLKRATSRIDNLIDKTEFSIELLREHRTALISAAVTGRIDVRESA